MPYAMSVIISRAIPEIDGLKPSHRKLLYTMYKMGLLTGGRVKSADVVGQTMRLNPHGDGPIYETMVRLTRGYDALLHPLVDSKGNFGKHYSRDMAFAASRYTEVKLDAICAELFKNIDRDAVDFIDNYNATTKEPALLPTTFPNVLVSPNQGIAVGMASSICSFNLQEVCAATIALIKNPEANLMEYLKAPDFATGGELLYDEKEIETIYATGRGGFKLRAKYRYDKKNSCIEVYEIPYTTSVEAIIDKLAALVKSGKVKEITDVRDETDLGGLKLTVDIRRSADPDMLMRRLYSLTPLSDSFSANFNVLIDSRPRTVGVRELLTEWVRFRVGCLRRQFKYDVAKKREKLHLLEGLAKVLLDIDKAIRIIRHTEAESLVIPNLCSGFGIDEPQAEYIADIKLRNLNREYLLNRVSEHDALKAEISELEALLADEDKIKAYICGELRTVSKKYGKPRRTDIVTEDEAPPVTEFIEDYGIRLYLTDHNYFKKIPLAALRTSPEQNLKDDDFIAQEIETPNRADVLFFSDKHAVYKCKAHELADCKASGLGEYLSNMLGLDENERIISMAATADYSGYMLFAFANGKMAKVAMSGYATKVNRKKLVNAYSDKSPPVYSAQLPEDGDYAALRDKDKAMLFNTALVPTMTTKNASGIQIFTLKRNSKLTAVMPAAEFAAPDAEYYRISKVPSTGHFLLGDYSQIKLPN
ncbi:MAG: topoisomerase IV [Defluviitaleaceae bacterium]|nr:topoisomerase IV [Defluviitaleaceae bacterium]